MSGYPFAIGTMLLLAACSTSSNEVTETTTEVETTETKTGSTTSTTSSGTSTTNTNTTPTNPSPVDSGAQSTTPEDTGRTDTAIRTLPGPGLDTGTTATEDTSFSDSGGSS